MAYCGSGAGINGTRIATRGKIQTPASINRAIIKSFKQLTKPRGWKALAEHDMLRAEKKKVKQIKQLRAKKDNIIRKIRDLDVEQLSNRKRFGRIDRNLNNLCKRKRELDKIIDGLSLSDKEKRLPDHFSFCYHKDDTPTLVVSFPHTGDETFDWDKDKLREELAGVVERMRRNNGI